MHSASLDGEATGAELDGLTTHLERCAPCRAHAEAVEIQHRAIRVSEAAPVPDLRAGIVAEVQATRIDRGLRRMALRAALAAVAAVQLVLALPQLLLLVQRTDAAHELRHLGGWDLAFATALVVVVVQPWRARGLLPMATAVGVVMVSTAIIDLIGGHTSGMPESQHALELLGLVLLWRLARIERLGWEPHGRRRSSRVVPAPDEVTTPTLRIVGEQSHLPAGDTPATGTADSA